MDELPKQRSPQTRSACNPGEALPSAFASSSHTPLPAADLNHIRHLKPNKKTEKKKTHHLKTFILLVTTTFR